MAFGPGVPLWVTSAHEDARVCKVNRLDRLCSHLQVGDRLVE